MQKLLPIMPDVSLHYTLHYLTLQNPTFSNITVDYTILLQCKYVQMLGLLPQIYVKAESHIGSQTTSITRAHRWDISGI